MPDDAARALGGGALGFALVGTGGILIELNNVKNRLALLEQGAGAGGVSQAQLSSVVSQVNAAFANVSQEIFQLQTQLSKLQSDVSALRSELAALQAALPPGRMR